MYSLIAIDMTGAALVDVLNTPLFPTEYGQSPFREVLAAPAMLANHTSSLVSQLGLVRRTIPLLLRDALST